MIHNIFMLIMVKYGLVGTFVTDKLMTIKTYKVDLDEFNKLLRKSLLHLLAWIQRTVLLSDTSIAFKQKITNGLVLDYDLNKQLLVYYCTHDHKDIKEINNQNGKYTTLDVVHNCVFVTKIDNTNNYLIMVYISHGSDHNDMIPLLCLSDV